MKIGIMGLGTIAQKAYLPIIGAMQEIDWVIHTRNEEILDTFQRNYNFKHVTTDFDDFINSGITACFIHTPTHTHYDLIKIMLERGIHVYVDKPLSDNIEQTRELIAYAHEHNLILMTGFNRRHAPFTMKLKSIENKNMIVIRKNRPKAIQDTHFAVYDMMIHVIDTALFLLDDEIIKVDTKLISDDNIAMRCIVNIETATCSLIAYMNMMAGAAPETFEVMSETHHAIVDDLSTYTIKTPTNTVVETFPDWTPTLEKRGFTNIINHFIKTVEKDQGYDASQDLASHEMIHTILKAQNRT